MLNKIKSIILNRLWSNLNPISVIAVFTALLVIVISNVDNSIALPFLNFLLAPVDATLEEMSDAKNKAENLLSNIFNELFSETGDRFTNF